MSRERGEEPASIVQMDLEREELTRRFRSLLMDASVSPEKWIEVRELLDPYLEYVSFRITGRLPNSATLPQDTNLEQDLLRTSLGQIDSFPDLLNVRETAEILRIAPLTVKRWGKRGILHPIRINERGDRRFRKDDLIQFMQSRLET